MEVKKNSIKYLAVYMLINRMFRCLEQGILYVVLMIVFVVVPISCGLFDKDLKQDQHIALFRNRINTATDSLRHPKERIELLETVLNEIKADPVIFNERKKNKVITECYFSISNEYNNMGKYQQAIDVCNVAISIDTLNSLGFYNRGCIHQTAENDSLAILDYTHAIKLKRDYADAFYNRAIVYESMEDYEKALSDYNSILKLNPSYITDVYINRGDIYRLLKEYEKAIADYTKVIEIDATNTQAYRRRAAIYKDQGKPELSLKDYSSLLTIDSLDIYAYAERAKIYSLLEMRKEEASDYKKVTELDPKNKKGLSKNQKKSVRK